ncbi:MAG: PxKF domain-containing protein [Thermomicrobiales bacterium]
MVSTAACDSSEYAIAAQGYTDENGLFSAPDIVPGSYCVIEAGAPLGYGNNQTPNHFVTVSEGETLTVTFTFEYHPPDPAVYGLVRLHIVDHVGNPVSGDSCAVISPSQVDGLTIICDAIPTQPESWRDGLIDIYVTGGGALLTSYQPPVMWQLAGTLPTTLLADPGEIIDLDIVLEPTGNGSVWVQTYRPSQTSEGVSGAVFDITDARNCSGSGNVVGQVTTALPANQPEQPASGILELPPGDYCAEFVSAPADVGYVITARQPFSVSAGWTEAVYFGFQDAPPARLRVIAQGASGIAAPEASFSIFSASDCANLQDNVGGISTDENGVGTYVNIDAGTYCVVHDQAPSGFGGLDVERQLITAVAGQTVDATFTYAVHPPDPAIYGLIRLEVLDDSGSPFSSENVCVTISPGQVNGETTICDVDPDVQGANLDGVIDIYVTASGASVVSMQPPLLWRLQDPSLLPLTLSVAPGEVVTEQVSIEPTGLGIANIVTYATPAIQPGATFDIREGSSCLDDDALAVPQLVTNVDGVAPDGFTAESYVELAPGDYCAIHVAAPSGLELHYASSPRQAFTIYSTGYSPVYFQYLYLDNTPASEDPVQVVPPGAPTGMTITFSAVLVPGVTTVTVDSDPPSIPAGFSLDGAIFYEIDTTASFDGLITICLPYDPGSFGNPSAVKLMHHEGGSWVDVTTSNDPVGGIICGSAVSLSPFGIMEPEGSTSNTPSSASPVTVSGLADGAVSVTFPSVTVAGATNAIPVGNSGDIPEGYAINSAIFYDIQTTATFTGLAEVCITFDSVQFFDRSEVRLFHDVGGEWIDITSGGDPANGTICGMTDHFSPFGVMEPEPLTGSLTIELRNELGGLQPGYCIWLNNPNDQWILLCDDQNDDPDDQWDGVISAELPVGVYTTGSYGPPDNYGLTSSLPTSIEITESGPVVLTLNHAPLTEATIFVDIVDGDGNPITGGCAGPFVPSTPGYRDCWWLDANGDGTVVISGIFTSGTVELGVLIGQGVTYGDWHASGSAEIAVGLTYAELTIVVEPSVVITSTIDGTPAPVDACYQLGDWVGCDRVDGLDGRTVLYGLPAGEYELSLYDSYVTSVSAVDLPRNVTVTGSGTDEIVVDFMTNAPSLVVNLEDDDGAPVLSGCFELTGVSHPVACDRDDGVIDGATSFHGLAGQGEVSLAFIGEIELQGCCDAIAVDLTEEATVEIDYLAPSPVFVLVVTDQDGNPWIVSNPWQHGAGQLCYSVESESHFSSCDAWDGQLDGRVTFYEYGGLYPGTYSLIRYGESVSVPLVITGGATQYVPITIMRTEEAARAVITAVDEAGVPASGACYQLHGPSWTTSLCDSSDGVLDGIATYRSSDPLDPGTLTVIEEKAPDGLARTLSTVIEHNGEMPVEITIEHSGYLTGEGEVTIVDEDTGITLTFANVVKPGRTTVEPISVGETPFPPDSGVFGLGGAMYYEISTTATFLDAITICLPSSDPADRLLHFDDGAWHDVTDDGFPSGGTICGTVRSLSPFAVVPLKETAPDSMVVSGFYAPVDMAEGVYNSVKGGSTVPLKFEVHQDGVELTDTGVIASFTVSTISCDPGANEDAVEYTTLGGTNLKYSGGMFHQNWKTPKSKGCYKVVVTTVDGATLVAYFRLR